MAEYGDYTRDIAELEGVQARSLGTIGNAIQAAPQAIGAAGAAMEGIGKNLDEARFTALKAQGLDAMVRMAQDKGHTPEQITMYKALWNQSDGQNKAYLMFSEAEKQNHQKKMGELVANEFSTPEEYMAAKADADAKGIPLTPPAIPQPGAQTPDVSAPPVTAPPAVGEKPVVNMSNEAMKGISPDVANKLKKGAVPKAEATVPVVKPLVDIPKTDKDINATVDLTSARIKSVYDKAGVDVSALNNLTLNDVRKIALSIYSDQQSESEQDKHIKKLLSNPEAAADLGQPDSVIKAFIDALPKDQKQENRTAIITKLMDTYIAETKGTQKSDSQDVRNENKIFDRVHKYYKDYPIAANADNLTEMRDRFGLFDKEADPNKFSATGFVGYLVTRFPNVAEMISTGAEAAGYKNTSDYIEKAKEDRQIAQNIVVQALLAATGKAGSEKERSEIKSSLGIQNFSNPYQVKAGIERFLKSNLSAGKKDHDAIVEEGRRLGVDMNIPGFINPEDLYPKESATTTKINATQDGAATPNTAPSKGTSPMVKKEGKIRSNTMTRNKPSTAKATDVWHDLGDGMGYWGPQ